MTNRRNFLKAAAVVGGAAAIHPGIVEAAAGGRQMAMLDPNLVPAGPGNHKLPDLPYAFDALEPYLDAKTLEIHHDKHHAGYVNGLNETEKELAEARKTATVPGVPALVQRLAFNAAGHLNHSIFWENMAPKEKAKSLPTGKLAERILKDFGSFDAFKAQFTKAGEKVEGAGWSVLAWHPYFQRLYVGAILNHQNSTIGGSVPLLLCDVWEHAYYLKYQNKRGDFIQAWWNVVNWADVERRFEALTGG